MNRGGTRGSTCDIKGVAALSQTCSSILCSRSKHCRKKIFALAGSVWKISTPEKLQLPLWCRRRIFPICLECICPRWLWEEVFQWRHGCHSFSAVFAHYLFILWLWNFECGFMLGYRKVFLRVVRPTVTTPLMKIFVCLLNSGKFQFAASIFLYHCLNTISYLSWYSKSSLICHSLIRTSW